MISLNRTLDGDKNLNSAWEFYADTKRKLAMIEEELQKAYVYHVYLNLKGILVILTSKHPQEGVFMQKVDNILDWIIYHINCVKT